MFFQISPVIKKKSKPLTHKKNDQREFTLEVLSLAPFTPNPKIVFEDVVFGTSHTRKLLIKNPTSHDVQLFVKKPIPEEINFKLSWTEAKIKSGTEVPLEMTWNPTSEVACRQNFTLSDGKRINRDIAVTFKSVAPKRVKATSSKNKLQQMKSPIKVSLKKKMVSPTKNIRKESERNIPTKYTSPKRKSPKRKSPFKYCFPSDECHLPNKYSVHEFRSCNMDKASNYQKIFDEKKSYFEANIFNTVNKENMSPSRKQYLCNASASFSPPNATFSVEIDKNSEEGETYFINSISGFGETNKSKYFGENGNNTLETNYSGIQTEDTYTIENIKKSPNFSDSLESPYKTPLREQNGQNYSTPTLESLLNNSDTSRDCELLPNFEYKLKNFNNFEFSPAVSPHNSTKQNFFTPTMCSTNSKSSPTDNSYKNTFLPAKDMLLTLNQSVKLNLSSATYTKENTYSETYIKSNSSFGGNISSGTYINDSSINDLGRLETSPVSSRMLQNTSPTFLQSKSYVFSHIENQMNTAETRKTELSSITEESGVFSESSIRSGSKRKHNGLVVLKPNNNWSKKGGAAFRIAKSTSGLNVRQFVEPTVNKSVPQLLITCSENKTKSVIIQNPFLYANIFDPFMASQVYCDDEWIIKQEIRFQKWLNILLTPPKELNTKTEIDVAKIWKECKNIDVSSAPTKEDLSLNFHTNSKLDYLRKQAQNLFRSKEMSDILQKVCIVIETGKLSIREDKDLHLNLKLKSEITGLLLNYNPLWLRIGLETIYNEIIPLKSNSDTQGLANFILERFLKDPLLLKKHKSLYAPRYSSDLKKFILKKFLILVYFLDRAKNIKLIQHDPCLFCKNATEKESKLLLTHFARETLSGVGDITKYLKCLGYVVTHAQTYINEFDYAVTNLGTDLRDGVRLARVMEIIQIRNDLTMKLRVPAISRLQKVHNMQLVFTSLQESGYEVQYDICAKDIVDGHKEKTLSFLWQIIYKFEAPLMVSSATTIQAWFRSLPIMLKRFKLRRIYDKRENAALQIQRWYKRQKLSVQFIVLARELQNDIKQRKREKSAIKIQSFFKMVICRKTYLKKYNVIKMFQPYVKGWLARRNIKNIIAAKLIQRVFRGYICRKQFKLLKDTVIGLQRKFRAKQEMRRKKHEFAMLKEAAIVIQRRYKANVEMRKCRKHFTRLIAAVIKIQSFYKMCVSRRQFLQILKCTKIIQTKYKAHLAMKRERYNFLMLKNAVIIIQRRFRTKKKNELRKQFLAQKNAAVKLQSYYRMHTLRKHFLAVRSATHVIQIRYKANMAMRKQKLQFITIKNSAVIIQQYFRAYVDMKNRRKSFLELKIATIKIQSFYKMYKCRKHFLNIQKAVQIIQMRYRSHKVMLGIKKHYLILKKYALYIQRRFRANQLKYKIRSEYIRIRQSAIIIQSHYKMLIKRRRFLQLKLAVLKIQRRFRALKAMEKQRDTFLNLRNSAIIFQRRWRARKLFLEQQQRYLQLKKATLIIQQRYKANMLMQEDMRKYKNIRQAAVKIQTFYRAILLMRGARYNYLAIKSSVLVIEKRYVALKLMQMERTRYVNLKTATLKIQHRYKATIQMRIQRNTYLTQKLAVLNIQRWYRSIKIMKKAQSSYDSLKKVALFLQCKFRANKAMKFERSKYIIQKKAAIRIQVWYRTTIKMKKCRSDFQSLKLAVTSIETRYKAMIAMKQQRNSYETLKNSTIAVQRRYRANLLMKRIRRSFIQLKNATIIVQRTFRANKLATIERSKYFELKQAAICIQRRYRAHKSMKYQREKFLNLKKSAISIQRYYRSQKKMNIVKKHFIELRKAVVAIQIWYRAQKLKQQYQNQRRAAIFIQQKYRANMLAQNERIQYLKLKSSVLIIQRRFRAQVLMKLKHKEYNKLLKISLLLQRKFRATILMRKIKYEYEILRKATIVIQRRFRATRTMRLQRLNYVALKQIVILLQQRFRANKIAHSQRLSYLQLKQATLVIQRRFRAVKSRKYQEKLYLRIRQAVLTIQLWYRTQKAMRKELLRYQEMRRAACVIQRKFKAIILGKIDRRWFIQVKKSSKIIQIHFRSYLLMKKERNTFLAKYKSIIGLQTFARGYLVRKKCLSMLTPKAIEARRILKIRSAAAIRIQATWRGYQSRISNVEVIANLKQKLKEKINDQKSFLQGRTLAQRREMAMLCMTSENSSLLMVIKALEDLDFITRHCRDSCIHLSLILPNQLYIIISSAARSLPEMSACNMAAFILINFCKYPKTRKNSWNAEYIDSVVNVLLNWCDKEAPLFSTLCTLLWLFAQVEEWKKVILGLPSILQKFKKIQSLVQRKQNMVIKSKKACTSSVFGPILNMKVPTINANWGLDYNRPNTFTNAVFALTNLMQVLDIIK